MMFVQTEVLSGLSRAHFQLQMGKLETKQRSLIKTGGACSHQHGAHLAFPEHCFW